MIIQIILDAIIKLFTLLTTPIDIPELPTSVSLLILDMMDYVQAGAGILANYTDLGYLLVLFGIIVGIDVGIKIYHFIMWIIKKIPMLGIQ